MCVCVCVRIYELHAEHQLYACALYKLALGDTQILGSTSTYLDPGAARAETPLRKACLPEDTASLGKLGSEHSAAIGPVLHPSPRGAEVLRGCKF